MVRRHLVKGILVLSFEADTQLCAYLLVILVTPRVARYPPRNQAVREALPDHPHGPYIDAAVVRLELELRGKVPQAHELVELGLQHPAMWEPCCLACT